MYNLFVNKPVDLTSQVVNYPDPSYSTAFLVGLGLTIAALVFSIMRAQRERKDSKTVGRV